MNDAELERIERIVASLAEQMAEQNRAYAIQREKDRAEAERHHAEREKEQAKLDKQLAELAEENRAYAIQREKDHAKLDAQLAELAEENRAYAIQREKDRAEHAKREEERVEAETQREEERATREAKYAEERRRERAEANKRMNKLDELFTGQWGKLMEALVKGELTRLLNQRGIPVQGLAREHERKHPSGREYELDIIAINGSSVVAVEVKTTLQLEHVHSFLEKLPRFKDVFWEYHDKAIVGAVAYLKANQGSNIYAAKQGLYVIRAIGNGASIINATNFKPRIF